MKKIIIIVFLLGLLCGQAIAGDSLLVAIRGAKNLVGTTDVSDSCWNEWANEGYQFCLINGYAYVRDTIYTVDSLQADTLYNYPLPSDFYEWIGGRVISGDVRNIRNIKLLIFGQEHEIGLGEGTGEIHFVTLTEDSIRFHPDPISSDTVLIQYYSDDTKLADTAVMKIKKVYTPIVVDFILSRYYLRMYNPEMGSFYRQLAEAELDKLTTLRRRVKADYVIPPKILEK